jgi:phosphohistidine phosphatase
VELYVVRHAIAVPRGKRGVRRDADRMLTLNGISRMRRHAAVLVKLKVRPVEIWTSPYVRARQTADILRKALGNEVPLREIASWACGGAHAALFAELKRRADRKSIMLVGHEPDLSAIVSTLVFGRKTGHIDLRKGGACRVDVEDWTPATPRGTLRWLLPPRIVRLIKKV